jgi:hypothetical protein
MDNKIQISDGVLERHDKIMAYIAEHYPNCKELSFAEQDRILAEALLILNL